MAMVEALRSLGYAVEIRKCPDKKSSLQDQNYINNPPAKCGIAPSQSTDTKLERVVGLRKRLLLRTKPTVTSKKP